MPEEVIFIDDPADNSKKGFEPGMEDYTFQEHYERQNRHRHDRAGQDGTRHRKVQDFVA
jgi:hypothetical protein